MIEKLCCALWLALFLWGCSAPPCSMDLRCARVEWIPPERTEDGGELPLVRVMERGDCGEITFEVRAIHDADRDGEPDEPGAASVTTGRVGPDDREAEVSRVRLLGTAPLRWSLWLRTAEGDALVDLGWIR